MARTFAAVLITTASSFACSSGTSPSNPASGGGTVQIPGGAGKAFVPDGIVYEPIMPPGGADPSGLKLLAATLHDYGNLQLLFMTVQNMGTQIACQNVVETEVDDAAMNVLGGGSLLVNAQMYSIPGGVTTCLGPGEIGIGELPALTDPVPAAVARIRYQFTPALEPSGAKVADVVLDALTVANTADAMGTVSGHLTNHGAAAVQNIVVSVFAIDGATLRPYAKGLAGVGSVAAGAEWDFTVQVNGPIADYRAFVSYEQP